jgi:hypothetical protein
MLEEMTLAGGHAASKDEAEWGRIEETIAQEVKKKDHLYLLAERVAPNLAPVGFAEARLGAERQFLSLSECCTFMPYMWMRYIEE